MADLNVIEKANLFRDVARIIERINVIERKLSGDQIDSVRIKDAAITNAKIDSLTWDKGQGGTLSLGGAANVDGVLSLKDASDVEKILLDKDGILIKSGKLTIKNDSNQTVVDAKGMVSDSDNFISSQTAADTLAQSITSGSPVDVTGATLTFSLSRNTNILILANFVGWVNQTSSDYGGLETILNVDGSEKRFMRIKDTDYTESHNLMGGTHYQAILSPGSHTIKLTAHLDSYSGSPTGKLYSFVLSYLLLGT